MRAGLTTRCLTFRDTFVCTPTSSLLLLAFADTGRPADIGIQIRRSNTVMAEAPRRFNHRRIAGFAAEELQADEIRTFAGNKKTPSWVFVFDESFHQAASLFEARGAGRTQGVRFYRLVPTLDLPVRLGLLVIIDGGKGLQAAVKKAFRKRALIQRCQWHKRENVVSYLSKGEQASWRKRLQWAYNRPEYEEALTALEQLHGELEERNQSAAGSLEEGLEETLTLPRLGVHAVLGRSFKTTNCLESGTCQQLWDTRELHLVSLDYGGETREVGAIDVNIDQDLVA